MGGAGQGRLTVRCLRGGAGGMWGFGKLIYTVLCPPATPKQLSSPCCASARAGISRVAPLPSSPTHTGTAAFPGTQLRRPPGVSPLPSHPSRCPLRVLLFTLRNSPPAPTGGARAHYCTFVSYLRFPAPGALFLIPSSVPGELRAPLPSSRATPRMPPVGASTSSTLGPTSFPASPNQESILGVRTPLAQGLAPAVKGL